MGPELWYHGSEAQNDHWINQHGGSAAWLETQENHENDS